MLGWLKFETEVLNLAAQCQSCPSGHIEFRWMIMSDTKFISGRVPQFALRERLAAVIAAAGGDVQAIPQTLYGKLAHEFA